MKITAYTATALLSLVIMTGGMVADAAADSRIRGAKLCTAHIPSHERQYGIPSHLLSAIASTESGRYHDRLKILLPWPWTINVEGKGYYFDSKAEAVAAVKKYQAQGKRSIDVGCMQVNLRHHGHHFASVEKAMDPRHNIQYAASFLRNLYESQKNWRKAAAAYHSKTPSLGSKYVAKVFRAWETIIARLRLPKESTIRKADKPYSGALSKPVKLTRAGQAASPAAPAAVDPDHEPVKMRVIKVTDSEQSPRDNIIMIKPDVPASAAQKAALASSIVRVDAANGAAGDALANAGEASTAAPNSNIIRLDGSSQPEEVAVASAEDTRSTNTGPRFIFTD